MKYLLLTLSFLISLPCHGNDQKHRIDVWVQKNLDTGNHMNHTLYQGIQMWDKEMNATYSRLIKKLSNKDAQELRAAQRAWIAYRDANSKSIDSLVASKDGSMWQLTATDMQYEEVKRRAKLLLNLEDVLSEE